MIGAKGEHAERIGKAVADNANVFLQAPGGVLVFEWRGPCTYEAHAAFQKGFRGRNAIEAGRDALWVMRWHLGGDRIWAGVPVDDRASRFYCRKCGMYPLGITTRPDRGECEIFIARDQTCPQQ